MELEKTSPKRWWSRLSPWLDAVRVDAGAGLWTGYDAADTRVELDRGEGPLHIRSMSSLESPGLRRTFAACHEYVLDIAALSAPTEQPVEWSLKASLIRPLQPPSFPRPGAILPLEAQWSVEWRTASDIKVRTTGESMRGTEALWASDPDPRADRWSVRRPPSSAHFTVCHEPAHRPSVQATFTLIQREQYTIRVTGNGYFDYWMLDPAHIPAPLLLDGEPLEVGSGWGYVRLEHGRETAYGALRRDWGLSR